MCPGRGRKLFFYPLYIHVSPIEIRCAPGGDENPVSISDTLPFYPIEIRCAPGGDENSSIVCPLVVPSFIEIRCAPGGDENCITEPIATS